MTDTISSRLLAAAHEIDQLVEELATRIEELPQNPRITKLSEAAFTLRFTDLGRNWTPEHHDFSRQYSLIAAIIRKSGVSCVAKLQSIIAAGKVPYGTGRHHITLHPGVVEHLSTLILKV